MCGEVNLENLEKPKNLVEQGNNSSSIFTKNKVKLFQV